MAHIAIADSPTEWTILISNVCTHSFLIRSYVVQRHSIVVQTADRFRNSCIASTSTRLMVLENWIRVIIFHEVWQFTWQWWYFFIQYGTSSAVLGQGNIRKLNGSRLK